MEFSQQDIESVAKGRVSREEGKRLNRVVWAMFIGVFAGFLLAWRINIWLGFAVIVAAVIYLAWENSKINAKLNKKKYQLVCEWKEEQVKKAEEETKKLAEDK